VPDRLNVGITGTRRAPLPTLQIRALGGALAGIRATAAVMGLQPAGHHGICTGTDEAAHHLMRQYGGWLIEGHPGHNTKGESPWRATAIEADCDVLHEPLPYGSRNEDITIASAILVAAPAYPEADSRSYRSGTWQTIRMARERLPMIGAWMQRIVYVWPDGRVEEEKAASVRIGW
jgi:hypothetical protein